MVFTGITLLDLFSGIGGFPLGLIQSGFNFKKHYFSEIDKYAIANYSLHFKNAHYAGPIENIKKEQLEKPDIVCFGSPCQDLSIAGKRRGIQGSKSRLFFEAVRIIDQYHPRLFIFENVKGLFSSNKGKDFEIVLKSFADLGVYDLQWQLLNTSWFLPQNRERIYLVGSLRGEPRPKVFPFPKNYPAFIEGVKKTIAEAHIAPTIDTKVGEYGTYAPYIITSRKRKDGQQIEFRKNQNTTNCITGFSNDNLVLNPWKPLRTQRTEKAKKIRRENQKKGKDYAPFQEKQFVPRYDEKMGAVTAHPQCENLLFNSKTVRRLTPLECERLQGFPDQWTKNGILDGQSVELSDSRRYGLVGNAVSVPIVKMIGKLLLQSNLFTNKLNAPTNMLISPLEGLGQIRKTPISYYGGKQNLSKLILSLIPKHRLYCEPFVGGAAIFFAKEPSEVEVLNDLNGEVVNFYRTCKLEFPKLKKLIDATPHSRKLHKEAAEILKSNTGKDPVKRAWAFWVQTNMSFSSRIFGGYAYEKKTNGVSKTLSNKKNNFTKEICDRLELVDIECNDALKVIQSRDAPDSFFYVDPPYFNSDMGHYKGYTEKDFIDLLTVLSKIQGKFLLSSYPSDILEKYKAKGRWFQHSIEKTVSVNTGARNKKKTEVLTANYDISKNISLSGLNPSKRLLLKSKALHIQFDLLKKE